MAGELKRTDISDAPELLHLAEEVHRTQEPYFLMASEPVPFIDTDVLIRLLTGDDPKKQADAAAFFQAVAAGCTTYPEPRFKLCLAPCCR